MPEFNRRDFLKTAGAALGALALGPLLLKPDKAQAAEIDMATWMNTMLDRIPPNSRGRFANFGELAAKENLKTTEGIRIFGADRPISDPVRFANIFKQIDILELGLRPDSKDPTQIAAVKSLKDNIAQGKAFDPGSQEMAANPAG